MLEYFRSFKKYAFRLEVLQNYIVEDEKAEFNEFLKSGKVKMDKSWEEIITSAKKRKAKMQRIHVIRLPLSNYLRFEIAAYKLSQKAGEKIFLLEEGKFRKLKNKISNDFWLFDDKVALRMKYDESGKYVGFQETRSVEKLIESKELLLKKAKPLESFRVDSFSQKVFSLVSKIPKGKVTTYREIAHAMNTQAYRAIGNILARNDGGFLEGGSVPCHRVVRSDGNIGGYCGQKCGKLVCEKKNLLKKEGIKFIGDKIVDFEKKIHYF